MGKLLIMIFYLINLKQDSIKSLEKINCFSVLTDILCDESAQEWTRTEAAGCIGINKLFLI